MRNNLSGDIINEIMGDVEIWIREMMSIEYKTEEGMRNKVVMDLIIKFILIQILDTNGVIGCDWFRRSWEVCNESWEGKGKDKVVEELLEMIDETIYRVFRGKISRTNFIKYIDQSKENMERLYEGIGRVIGVSEGVFGGQIRGIIQYNFRDIEADILGKLYERYLIEGKKTRGVYYTPVYIIKYIVESTIEKLFNELIMELKGNIENKEYRKAITKAEEIKSVRILDPACGTGGFLVEAIRVVERKYIEIFNMLECLRNKYLEGNAESKKGKLENEVMLKEENRVEYIEKIKEIIGLADGKVDILRLVLRHIYGNDIDKRALEIAKLNIWLEIIKKIYKDKNNFSNRCVFNNKDITDQKMNYRLPDLGINLTIGNALVGLKDEYIFRILRDNRAELKELGRLYNEYLESSGDMKIEDEIKRRKNKIIERLNLEFEKSLEKEIEKIVKRRLIKPFHWIVEYWHVFFDEEGVERPEEICGFDVIIGNPPYIDSEEMSKTAPELREYISKTKQYKSAVGNWDIYCVFIEKGLDLLKKGGRLSYVVPNKLMSAEYARAIREIIKKNKIESIRDYSNVNPFSGVAVYPIVITIRLQKWRMEDRVRIEVMKMGSNQQISIHIVRKVPLSRFYSRAESWSPYIAPDFGIFKKVREVSSRIEEYFEVIGAATVSESYKIKEKIRELNERIKGKKYIKFINTGTIDKYVSLWGHIKTKYIKNKYNRPVLLDEDLKKLYPKRYEQARRKKIIIAGISKELECFYDTGNYLAGKSTVIILEKEKLFSLMSLIPLLNSTLLSYMIKQMYRDLTLRGGYLRVGPPQVKRLFISNKYITNSRNRRILENFGQKIINYKKARYKYMEIWSKIIARIEGNMITLSEILLDSEKPERLGILGIKGVQYALCDQKDDEVVIGSEMMDRKLLDRKVIDQKFRKIKVNGDLDNNMIEIYGIDDILEKLIYQIEFSDKDLMQYIYLSIIYYLGINKKLKSLDQLLKKIKIPINFPNIKRNMLNTMKNVKYAFQEWSKMIDSELSPNIIEIDNKIMELECKIDALIFRLYEFENSEVSYFNKMKL
ncbi:MAG: Eco57I restriction-modification methylase domain-containing protein [Candidatus Helarchaeota archaeon]